MEVVESHASVSFRFSIGARRGKRGREREREIRSESALVGLDASCSTRSVIDVFENDNENDDDNLLRVRCQLS